jgi:tRNA (mo5U34)-methyltransferase
METDELRRRVAEIAWFHTIDLGDGVVTPGVGDTPRNLGLVKMPEDLSGQTVLDIGAWDGFYSVEAEGRGASRVLATDSFCWSGAAWATKAGFDLAREALHSRVEDKYIDVMELSPESVGVFDLVLFMGVLYHLRHPLLALEKVASVTGGRLILETQVDWLGLRRPAMAFYPTTELNDDWTNWWAPNPSALVSMIKDVGFTRVEAVTPPYGLVQRVARAARLWKVRGWNPLTEYRRARIGVHAWK